MPFRLFALKKTWTVLMLSMFMFSCKHEIEQENLDQQLYEMAKPTAGFVWYKNNAEYLNRSASSGHSNAKLRTRYNSIAAGVLQSDGKITEGATFPEGSLVVKELSNASNALERYAILYKKSGLPETDERGWVWGYVNADGSVALEASEKGKSCISCHAQTDNIDYMLMNKYFP